MSIPELKDGFVNVRQWCPECDCERECTVVARFTIECTECGEQIPLSAENARSLET